ncbi:hypothetical protein A3K72_00715 [Candidatus Woesearchaeota archaeon RBG_13_36_6]|nr:MAG: hypothetical protein A3K72_00715 [Candidatus Woesearchaeota archaeon RBG_13_36_6]
MKIVESDSIKQDKLIILLNKKYGDRRILAQRCYGDIELIDLSKSWVSESRRMIIIRKNGIEVNRKEYLEFAKELAKFLKIERIVIDYLD